MSGFLLFMCFQMDTIYSFLSFLEILTGNSWKRIHLWCEAHKLNFLIFPGKCREWKEKMYLVPLKQQAFEILEKEGFTFTSYQIYNACSSCSLSYTTSSSSISIYTAGKWYSNQLCISSVWFSRKIGRENNGISLWTYHYLQIQNLVNWRRFNLAIIIIKKYI